MKKNIKISYGILIIMAVFVGLLILLQGEVKAESSDYIYLSDMQYVTSLSKAGYKTITYDKTCDGATLSLIVKDQVVTFDKGVFAHATSTVVYDLTDYSDYYYFTAYYGVSSLQGSKGNVKFYIYTSKDGTNWDLQTSSEPTEMTGSSSAQYVKIDIHEAKYLKLYADSNGSNGNDHALYGDAKLIKEDYNENVTKTVEEYDTEIKKMYSEEGKELTKDSELELLVLQRELVDRVGSYTLKTFIEADPEKNKQTLDWLMNDQETLRLYLVGGKPEGTYLKSLQVLSTMYHTYKDTDLVTNEVSKYNSDIKLKDVYRTMTLAISLTYSGNVYLWINGTNQSEPITRYEIYKKLYSEELIECAQFETLTVEEMRWVMNTIIDDEEIEWLNDYVRTAKNGSTSPYSYIKYTFGYNYYLDKYYNADNYNTWDEKYNLSTWGIKYGDTSYPKLWIVFEEGSVCGGLSKTGSCIWGSYKGLPNTCVSQPGHCAYIYYAQNSDGDGVWALGNDVYGWSQSGKTEHLNIRMMNDWGNTGLTGWTASYILLAQGAQNEYDKYEEAEIKMMLSSVYSNDSDNQEKIYREALETESINYDAWLALINLYKQDSAKTEKDYYELAEDVTKALTYYPRPMYDLLALIQPKFTSPAYIAQFNSLITKALTKATNATSDETLQVTAVKQVANALLGFYDNTIASFSFDGENANSIVLSSQFGDSDVQWNYSLDGGTTWTETSNKIQKLTDEEINSITAQNDIRVHIMGTDYTEDNICIIDITDSAGLPTTLYANDLENKLIAVTSDMEWRYTSEEGWISYSEQEPDLTGDKSIEVRVSATGTALCSSPTTYTFTENKELDTMKYLSIEHLSIYDFSSQSLDIGRPHYAPNAIDGNINTEWHTNFAVAEKDETSYITIKLDEAKYISKIEYLHMDGNYELYGYLKNGTIYVSQDGENWEEVKKITNLSKDTEPKEIIFDEPVLAEYVKITMESYDNVFMTAAMINFYYDVTKENSVEDVQYDIQNYGVHEENKIIYKILPNTTFNGFKANIITNQNLQILDKNGNELTEDGIIKTGMIMKINDEIKYNLSVLGDLDEDGEMTLNDLAQLKLHLINEIPLDTDARLQSADLDLDGEITLNDLAKQKLVLIKKISLD